MNSDGPPQIKGITLRLSLLAGHASAQKENNKKKKERNNKWTGKRKQIQECKKRSVPEESVLVSGST